MMAAFLLGPHGVMAAEEDFGANLLASSPAPYSLNLGEGLNGLALRLHGADKSRVLTYNLAERRMEFSFDVDATNILAKRLFCLDLGSGDGSSSGPRLLGRDVDEQIVIDAPLGSPLSYLYNEVLFESTLDQDVRCFSYQTDDESELVFSLLGAPLPQPTLFSDRFELVPGLTISFLTADTDQPAQPLRSVARLSEAEDRLFPYRVRLSNKGTLNIEGISMQLLEMFDSVYDARFNDQDLVEVVCVPGSTVPGASCGSSVDNLTLRRHDIKLPPQSYVDFFLTRQIEPTSDLGQSIVLNAGAVTLETHNNRPIFAANTHEIILIGDGTWISAKEPQSAVLVSDSLADSHHLVEVAAWDSDPDAACTSNSADCSTPLQGLEIEITDICRVTAAPRGLSDCIPVDSSKVHFDSTAVTDEDGIARFKVASELADALRVTFTVTDDTLGTLALDSSRADQLETATVVTFLPDQPAGLGQISALTTAQAGENLGLEIEVVDRFGNRVGCDPDNAVTVNLTLLQILSSGGPIWVHEGQDFNCGLITFDNVAINRTGNGYEIRAGATGFNSVNTLPITITPGNPHQLNFQVQPSTVIAGQPIFPPVVVRIEDAFGNLTNSSAAVDLSLAADPSGEASLDGNTSTAVDGVASFPSLSVDRSGSGFLLEANSTDLLSATSEAFDVLASAPVSIGLTGPDTQAAGEFGGSFTVTILDDFENPTIAPSDINIDLSSDSDANGTTQFDPPGPLTILAGESSANFQFSNTAAELTTITASTAAGSLNLDDGSFVVETNPAAPYQLVVITQPDDTTAGELISLVQVEVQDIFGNHVVDDETVVEVELIDSLEQPITLDGTLEGTASAGVASFNDLSTTFAGNDFRLRFTASDLEATETNTFDVSPGEGQKLEFSFIPAPLVSGLALSPALEVRVIDAFDNTATDYGSSINLLIGNFTTGFAPIGTMNANQGVATFEDAIPRDRFGQDLRFQANSGSLPIALSSHVDVSVAAFSFDDFDDIQANEQTQASVGVNASASQLDETTLIRYRITLLDDNGNGVEGFVFTYCADGSDCEDSETLETDASGQSFFGPVTGITASDAGIVDPQGSSSLFQFEMESGEFSLTVELLEVDGFDLDWLGEGTTNFTVVD